jgi:aspartate-semialdehyde dehydrogenase
MKKSYKVGIVGATGAVGVEMLRVMERRNFPVDSIKLLASSRSAGKPLAFRHGEIAVEALRVNSFEGLDIVFFSAGAALSKEYAPLAVNAGAVVVDNSSAFRGHHDVPLVVPEINGADVAKHKGIIANPNCTTAVTLMALAPLHKAFNVRRVFASSYQAVSGAGARAIHELREQSRCVSANQTVEKEVFPHQIAFNVIPHIDRFEANGYTREEMKMQSEGRRILHAPGFRASVTCVRVPVYRAHSVAVSAEFERPVDPHTAREIIAAFPGVKVVDEPEHLRYPMPIDCAGKDDCYVGRIRLDCAFDNGLAFWVCGDQLLKGAALNAVQIAELI